MIHLAKHDFGNTFKKDTHKLKQLSWLELPEQLHEIGYTLEIKGPGKVGLTCHLSFLNRN